MLGYETTDEPGVTKYGPQPYEGQIAAICSAFGCTPDVAERQEIQLVTAVMDYRNAEVARDLWNHEDKKRAFEALEKNPQLLRLLARMVRAQKGAPLEAGRGDDLVAEGMHVARMQSHTATGGDDDDEDEDTPA